jgi:hypothetical protein
MIAVARSTARLSVEADMAVAPETWVDKQYERVFNRQRAQVDTAKLLATFSSAVAATVVASALQVVRHSNLPAWSSVFLALAFALAIMAAISDRLHELEIDWAAVNRFASDEEFFGYVQDKRDLAEGFNLQVVERVKLILYCQLPVAGLSGAVATISLMHYQA